MKRLLVVYHSGGTKTARMAEAVARGAGSEPQVEVALKRCPDAGAEDVVAADALILGTPENFGYMSGMMKDFLERIFYPCEGRLEGRPYALFVGAGQDGSGAVASVERIVTGLRLRKAAEPVVCVGELNADIEARCEELGATFAAALSIGAL